MVERPTENPRRTHIHKRGEFLQPTDEVAAELPSLFAPLAGSEPHDRLALARCLVERAQPARWPRDGQSSLGGDFRPRHRADHRGFRLSGRPAHASRVARLAGRRVHARRLVGQKAAQADRHQRHLPSVVAASRPSCSNAIRKTSSTARHRACGSTPSWCATRRLPPAACSRPRSAGRAFFRRSRPASRRREPTAGSTGRSARGEDRYRRGMYTFSKRTAPYAMFATFDAPSGEACLARREVSNTPLQSLTLLNDAVFVEAAQALGRQIADGAASVEDRADRVVPSLRGPAAHRCRTQVDRRFLQSCSANASSPASSTRRQSPAAAMPTPPSRAAWTLTARAVLNLDETIIKE